MSGMDGIGDRMMRAGTCQHPLAMIGKGEGLEQAGFFQ
jgi:hypothetical protein